MNLANAVTNKGIALAKNPVYSLFDIPLRVQVHTVLRVML